MRILRKQTGDTIIEVLIAIAVVGVVLAGAYASANRSSNTTIRSREHDIGVELAQSQIELLPSVFTSVENKNRLFCIKKDSGVVDFAPGQNDLLIPVEDYTEAEHMAQHHNECELDRDGNTYSGSGARYLVSVDNTNHTPSSSGKLFKITVRWVKIGGGWDEVQLLYRMYE